MLLKPPSVLEELQDEYTKVNSFFHCQPDLLQRITFLLLC